MNRRNFLKTMVASLAVAIAAPSLLFPKSAEATSLPGVISFPPHVEEIPNGLSALTRIEFRGIISKIEKTLQHYLLEFNDNQLRQQIVHHTELLLDSFIRQGDIRNYKVQCDEYNNTPTVIDRNECHVTIWVQQNYSYSRLAPVWRELNFVMGPSCGGAEIALV